MTLQKTGYQFCSAQHHDQLCGFVAVLALVSLELREEPTDMCIFFLEIGVLPASASIDAHSHFITARVISLNNAWS
jgi:hypothetical protein